MKIDGAKNQFEKKFKTKSWCDEGVELEKKGSLGGLKPRKTGAFANLWGFCKQT
jgi:hypothetical protein